MFCTGFSLCTFSSFMTYFVFLQHFHLVFFILLSCNISLFSSCIILFMVFISLGVSSHLLGIIQNLETTLFTSTFISHGLKRTELIFTMIHLEMMRTLMVMPFLLLSASPTDKHLKARQLLQADTENSRHIKLKRSLHFTHCPIGAISLRKYLCLDLSLSVLLKE